MTILTRENLLASSFRRNSDLPSDFWWSDAELDRSLEIAWRARPEGAIWVFAYGSLIWNPLFAFEERQAASLDGWHRSFCLRSVSHRGSPDRPGRVLALEPGGQVQGVALRLHDDQIAAELRLLWMREMASGDYHPLWAPVILEDGREVRAMTFTINPERPLYDPDTTVETVAQIAAEATGIFGTNADYVLALDRALAEHGLQDAYVDAIACELRRVTRDKLSCPA
ncbi:MAG TPA: gamma-glutamylcyclotransferase [Aromatoleum sp.]|uniref:gamma-glutamylcyclotransferase n=1 Tax=Aromatoleum sp. TaxID=2307007 RepID=UPI002B4720A3|nr:gamma-glutamylcyclotransferase [Aromatoleum sp.]HJV25946.1 gamma-glutamylcyclotransferase [Aromatoleum sp.]